MPYDDTEFVDRDFPASHAPPPTGTGRSAATTAGRAPTREELDAQVTATQQQLAKLREAHDQLERAKAELEEMRRRRADFQAGRAEMLGQLTRGIGLLEKAEFEARRAASQMSDSLAGLRTALAEVETLKEEAWTEESWNQDVSRALTVIENARMEFGSARQKWPVLDGAAEAAKPVEKVGAAVSLAEMPMRSLLRLGLALTWPLLLIGGAAIAVLAVALSRR